MALGMVALLDLHREGRVRAVFSGAASRSLYVAYGAALLLLFVVRLRVTGTTAVPDTAFWDNPLVSASPLSRVATAITVVGYGVAKLVVPVGLSPDYSFNAVPVVTTATDPRFLATCLGVGLLALGFRRLSPRNRALAGTGVGLYLLGIFPASNLLVTVGTIFGDRLLYLPSVAFCLAAGAFLHRAAGSRNLHHVVINELHPGADYILQEHVTLLPGMLAVVQNQTSGHIEPTGTSRQVQTEVRLHRCRADDGIGPHFQSIGEQELHLARLATAHSQPTQVLAFHQDSRPPQYPRQIR